MSKSWRESGGRADGLLPEARCRERPLERRTWRRQTTMVTRIIKANRAVTHPGKKKPLNIIIGRIKNKDLSFLFTNDGEDGGMQESHVLLVSLLHAKLVEMSVGLE